MVRQRYYPLEDACDLLCVGRYEHSFATFRFMRVAVKITRVQVEGGFLDGLDLALQNGLNVLIGGRGTGKSSVIELIRFCLDVSTGGDEAAAKRSREQALSVLQDGQVIVSVEDDGNAYDVVRAANGDSEGLEAGMSKPLVFSQRDIESVGLSARGRLAIIDLFGEDGSAYRLEERRYVAQSQSLTIEIKDLLLEADRIEERLSGLDSVREELARAEARSSELSKASQQLEASQKQLDDLSSSTLVFGLQAEALKRAKGEIDGYRDDLNDLDMFGFQLDPWPEAAGKDDLLSPANKRLAEADHHLSEIVRLLRTAAEDIDLELKRVEERKAPLDEQARQIRRNIEGMKEGAGAAARQLANLRERASQLESLGLLRQQKIDGARKVQARRSDILAALEDLRDRRSAERQAIAKKLSADLMPSIRVKIREAAHVGEFTAAIANALKGSGLRSAEISEAVAANLTPRELVEAIENGDSSFLSKSTRLSLERAERVIGQLRRSSPENIIGIDLNDVADFELLDGKEFKPMDVLSVGQRCTVVLSILLEHPDRLLIVDQPEDHLDNAFISQTLIPAIRRRSSGSQLLLATHNANIPVLGGASRVIRMGSNGSRGFVVHAEPLNNPKSVSAIVDLMEGGEAAFASRDGFYHRANEQ